MKLAVKDSPSCRPGNALSPERQPALSKMLLSVSLLSGLLMSLVGCSLISVPYKVVKGTVTGGVWVVKTSYEVTAGTAKVVYRVGEFTFEVVKAPVGWALTHEEIDSIDGLPAKEAIRQNRVKSAPYVVRGKTYVPISAEAAQHYREEGLASWYGYESGRMTATGEAFNPDGLTGAHKYLPIPIFVQVTNLENGKSILVRVNDRGPFPSQQNPRSGDRIIDLGMGAAKRLGFYAKGLARVCVETIQTREG